MDIAQLYQQALQARANAYAPYSHFAVGACLVGKSGKIYLGCNVENASYGATICAERAAFARAITKGEREFCTIAIVGGKGDDIGDACLPCGICLQVMHEFCTPDFPVVVFDHGVAVTYALRQLLPHAFGRKE